MGKETVRTLISFITFVVLASLSPACAQKRTTKIFEREKGEKVLGVQYYGFENVGKKDYWWAMAHVKGKYNEFIGYRFTEHEWVVPPVYERVAKHFHDGLAGVQLHGRVGYVDSLNRFIIPPTFESADIGDFSLGLAPVKSDGKFGFINMKGAWVIKPQFDDAESFDAEDYLAVVKVKGRFGAIDLRGDTVVPCKYLTKEAMKLLPVKNKQYRAAVADARKKMTEGGFDDVLLPLRKDNAEVTKQMSDINFVSPASQCVASSDDKGLWGLKRNEKDTVWLLSPKYQSVKPYATDYYIAEDASAQKTLVDSYGRILAERVNAVNVYPESHRIVAHLKDGTATESRLYTDQGVLVMGGGPDRIGHYENGVASVSMFGIDGKIDRYGIVDSVFINRVEAYVAANSKMDNLQKLLQLCPISSLALNNIACLELKCEEYKDGIGRLKVAHELFPDDPTITANLKQAKSDRKDRRMNRALLVMSIVGAAANATAATYAAVKGVDVSNYTSSTSSYYPSMDMSGSSESSSYSSSSKSDKSKERKMQRDASYGMSSYRADSRAYAGFEDRIRENRSKDPEACRQYQKKMKQLREKITSHGFTQAKSPFEDKLFP